MPTFGALLREKRRAASVSQRDLAASAGLDFSYISKLENDRIPPPAANTVVVICRILKVEPEELLAAAGKLPADVHASVGTSQAAQTFLQSASQMTLTEKEWKELTSSLKRLRES
jgi:transcriptional regulator with XRE-family HTH domain